MVLLGACSPSPGAHATHAGACRLTKGPHRCDAVFSASSSAPHRHAHRRHQHGRAALVALEAQPGDSAGSAVAPPVRPVGAPLPPPPLARPPGLTPPPNNGNGHGAQAPLRPLGAPPGPAGAVRPGAPPAPGGAPAARPGPPPPSPGPSAAPAQPGASSPLSRPGPMQQPQRPPLPGQGTAGPPPPNGIPPAGGPQQLQQRPTIAPSMPGPGPANGAAAPGPPGLNRPSISGPPRPAGSPPGTSPPPAAAGWPPAGASGGLMAPPSMQPPSGAPPAPSSSLLSRPLIRPSMPSTPPPPAPFQRGTGGAPPPYPSTSPPPPPSSSLSAGVQLIRPGSIPAPGPVPELRRPDPPTLRVLESLMPPPGTAPQRLQLEEVVEDEENFVDEEDKEFLREKPSTKGGGKRKQKVTAEMRRRAAQQRKEEREEKAASNRKEREEIFEVGDQGMSLQELADKVQVEPADLVRLLFMKGIMLSMNQALDKNTCKVVAAEYGLLVVEKEEAAVSDQAKKTTEFNTDEDIDELEPRPPVVTVMGHVDHGKTSLLDYIRKARVAAGEAGGITQSIGAYNTSVEVDGETKTICFLDTPGHEAFSAMRARGAKMTDVAIIIVAADDGVRPQTREAVSHAQAAGVPLVVAINKVDKPGADVERVKQELLELNLVPEEWGGTTPMVAVSAKKGQGMADLLQMVVWTAEEQRLMANPRKPAQGTIIEAHLDKQVGAVATVLVQAGTLRVGDAVGAGGSCGRVRSMSNDLGQAVQEAGPSIALRICGLDAVPDAGEEFRVYPSEGDAREAAAQWLTQHRTQRLADMGAGGSMVTLSSLASVDEDSEGIQRMNLVIKADTVGVVQAIKAALGALPQESVALRYLLTGAGMITMSDVDLAAASQALLVGFNLEPTDAVATHAKRLGVNIMTYKVIYEIVDDIKAAMEGKLKAVEERIVLGKAEVKAIFGSGKKKVAGCVVTSGKVQKGAMVTVTRGKRTVYEGKLVSLRRLKDNVEEVSEGTECGLGCGDEFHDFAEGDVLECFKLVSKSRRLEEAKADTAVDIASLE